MTVSSGIRVVTAAALVAAAWLAALGDAPPWPALRDGLWVAAAAVAGYGVVRRALAAARARTLSIEALVTVAAAGAIAIGEYWEAAAVTLLFELGGYLEARTLDRARAAIRALAAWAPQTARVRTGEGDREERVVPADAVRPGDVMVLRAGDKVAADGVVVRGEAEMDEAALTGESALRTRRVGDTVLAGSVVATGFVEARATRVGQESTFGRILQLVGEAQAARTRVQTAVERFARYYTPAILVLAGLVLVARRDLHLALTLLVVACPGALVLAAPVSLVAGIGRAARMGVLVKGGSRLEQLARVDAVAFDKTGTLTRGRPEVVAVRPLAGGGPEAAEAGGQADEDDRARRVLLWAAAAEKASSHPVAAAILRRAREVSSPAELPDPDEARVLPGLGVAARIGEHRVLVGSLRLLQQEGVTVAEHVRRAADAETALGRSVVLVAVDGRVEGLVALADELREGARGLVPGLRSVGVRRVAMLTGDNPAAARTVAAPLGFDTVEAGLLPHEKLERLAALRAEGFTVAMVGDGINDAPALSAADASIAIGVGGTDAAVEAADLALVADDLGRIPYAIGLARAIVASVRQNLAFAVAVVLSLVAGVLMGRVHLASGMLVHQLSVLAVVLNGMRLLRWQPPPGP